VFFQFFLDTTEEDANHYCLNIRKEVPQDVLVAEELKPNLSYYARECLKVRKYEKNFKLKVEDLDHYVTCQAHLDFEMPTAKNVKKENCCKKIFLAIKTFFEVELFKSKDAIKNNMALTYSYVDFSEYILSRKLYKLRKAADFQQMRMAKKETMNSFTLSEICLNLI